MEDSKHAPSPWKWDEDCEVVFDAKGYEVADVYSLELGDGPLLAAAPDLLLACEAVFPYINYIPVPELDDLLRAAIGKAKGTKKL